VPVRGRPIPVSVSFRQIHQMAAPFVRKEVPGSPETGGGEEAYFPRLVPNVLEHIAWPPRRQPFRLGHFPSSAFVAASGTSTLVLSSPLSVIVRTGVPSTSALPIRPRTWIAMLYFVTTPSPLTHTFAVPLRATFWKFGRTSFFTASSVRSPL